MGECLDTISHFSTVVEVVTKMVINQSPVIVYSHEKWVTVSRNFHLLKIKINGVVEPTNF